jgi:hypothetical protein
MIADSTVHVFGPRLLKTAGIYVVCIAVFFAVTILDVTGYETRIPKVSQVKSVQVTGIAGGDFEEQAPVLTSPSAIQQATAFHRSIVEDRAGNNPEMGSNIINVVYNLKNGRAVFRTYTDVAVPAGSDKYKAMDALYRDPEYAAALKITFKEDNRDIPIMESFPAQFGAEAEEILLKSADVGLTVTEDSVLFTHNLPENTEATVGDSLSYSVTCEGQEKHIASGEIIDISNGRCSALLSPYGTAEEFLKFIFEYELKISKE